MLHEDSSVLQKFKEIMIEYHHGCSELAQKLTSAGFEVSVHDSSNDMHLMNSKLGRVGIIFAKKTS